MTLRPAGTALAALLLVAGSAAAQVPSTAPAALALPASPRAMALGGAYMMNSGHADALFAHPALLTGASGFGVDVQSWGGDGTAASASAATEWLGGGIAVGLQTFQAGLASASVPSTQDPFFTTGPVPVSERIATVGYARELFGVRVGLAGKLAEERIDGASSSSVLVDVGAAHDLGPLTVGLTVRDLGKEPFEAGDTYSPARIVLGAGAYGQQVGPLDMGLAAQVSVADAETLVGGGLEVGYWPISGRTFVGRIGVQSVPDGSEASPLTVGAAFWGDDLVLEWAYQGFGDLNEGTHRFGIRWR